MKNFRLVFILFLIVSVTLSTQTTKVNADSLDSMSFTSGVTLYSPINKTYSTKFLTLNLTAGVGIGINCTITYNIDNKHQGTVPLEAVYPELHVINKVKGNVTLPELTEGTHNLTLQVVCALNHQNSATMNRYPFIPECTNITDYQATWTDTIHFTINTADQQIPEFPMWIILQVAMMGTFIVVVMKGKKLCTKKP